VAAGGDRTGPHGPHVEEALAASARVVQERGRWVVLLDVVLASGAVSRRVGEFPDHRRAGQAARIIERNAIRFIAPAAQESGGAEWLDRP
jgi:hypothetical protein